MCFAFVSDFCPLRAHNDFNVLLKLVMITFSSVSCWRIRVVSELPVGLYSKIKVLLFPVLVYALKQTKQNKTKQKVRLLQLFREVQLWQWRKLRQWNDNSNHNIFYY